MSPQRSRQVDGKLFPARDVCLPERSSFVIQGAASRAAATLSSCCGLRPQCDSCNTSVSGPTHLQSMKGDDSQMLLRHGTEKLWCACVQTNVPNRNVLDTLTRCSCNESKEAHHNLLFAKLFVSFAPWKGHVMAPLPL